MNALELKQLGDEFAAQEREACARHKNLGDYLAAHAASELAYEGAILRLAHETGYDTEAARVVGEANPHFRAAAARMRAARRRQRPT